MPQGYKYTFLKMSSFSPATRHPSPFFKRVLHIKTYQLLCNPISRWKIKRKSSGTHNFWHKIKSRACYFIWQTKKLKLKLQNCGNSVAKKNVGQSWSWPFVGWRQKERKKSGECIGYTPAFSAAHHAAYMHMMGNKGRYMYGYHIYSSRVWINRVRLPILLVVS